MVHRERRKSPRMGLPARPPARAREAREVRLVDLSLHGAGIEHRGLLRPGAPCHLELPSGPGALVLTAEVVWSTIIGSERTAQGERQLLSRSGLRFGKLTGDQRRAVAETLQQLALSAVPLLDSHQGSA
jgi:PilZ domain